MADKIFPTGFADGSATKLLGDNGAANINQPVGTAGRAVLESATAADVRTASGTDASGTARPPTAHTHPVAEISDGGATGRTVLQAGTRQIVAALLGIIASQRIVVSADRVLTAAESGSITDVDASAATQKTTLPAHADGLVYSIFVAALGAGFRVNVHDSADVKIGELLTAGDTVTLRSNGTTWKIISRAIADYVETFTVSGTYARKGFSRGCFVDIIGAGQGGSSGRRDATSTARYGGCGGNGGGRSYLFVPFARIGTSETVTVGANGLGGQAQMMDVNNGNAGTGAGTSSFGSHLKVTAPGNAGAANSTSGGVVGAPSFGNISTGGLGTVGAINTAAIVPAPSSGAGAGCGAQGVSSTNVVRSGVGTAGAVGGGAAAAGAGGAFGVVAPSASAVTGWLDEVAPGSGGGGPNVAATGVPGSGGNGSDYGGGGSGGCGFLNASLVVARVRITNGGSGYTTASATDTIGTTYSVAITGGVITAITTTVDGTPVASGGAVPVITITGDGASAAATAMMQGAGGDGGMSIITAITRF